MSKVQVYSNYMLCTRTYPGTVQVPFEEIYLDGSIRISTAALRDDDA